MRNVLSKGSRVNKKSERSSGSSLEGESEMREEPPDNCTHRTSENQTRSSAPLPLN